VIAILLAGGVALVVSLVGTPVLMGWLRSRGIGQPIREEGPQGHVSKAGTPTMGGLMIVTAAVAGYLIAHVRPRTDFSRGGRLVLAAVVATALVGLVDDYLKVVRRHNRGLSMRAKLAGQTLVAVGFALLAMHWGHAHTTLSFTRFDSTGIGLGTVGWIAFAVFLMIGFSNAVNLTDGLDGLAAGSSAFAFAAFVVIGFWQFRHPSVYRVKDALDLGLASAAMLGGCTGFLWWNAAPARIFMGDVGSLGIGAGLAALGLLSSTQLLLPVVGGLFVLETLSVMIQVAAFRLFHRRVFRMAPFHHHFEQLDWPETTVIVRFWILAGLCTFLALAIFYADSIAAGISG
jgi:phospho-N-acetylmuramoyl-pentapeptide-transferase